MIGAGFSSGIRLLNRKFAQQEYVRFKGMSEQLGVSNQALAIRMKQMGLIEREYLKNPDDLVNIYVEDQEWQSELPCAVQNANSVYSIKQQRQLAS